MKAEQNATQATSSHLIHDPITAKAKHPRSPELGRELQRLEKEERIAIDRRRQEELARLREIQSYD